MSGEGRKLYKNNGSPDYAFTEVSNNITDGNYDVTAAAWGDYDNDGYPDLFLAVDQGTNKLFRNENGNSFTSITSPDIIAFESDDSFTCGWADIDGDNDLDLCHINGEYNSD